ncbi:DNA polymerase III subunit delta [Arenicella sp.]|nr:DNA polymerase III subunit delta [Arenicella sp.]
MRVAIDELASKLGSLQVEQLPNIILINGNEPLVIEEALDQVRLRLKGLGFIERLKYQLETGFDWSSITSIGMEMSLFSERRLIELRVPKSLGAAGTKAITEYCNKPPQDDILIVIMPLLDKRQRQAKWAKVVDGSGWLADCYQISPQQFPSWLKQRLQSRALRVESGVIELLTQQLEGNVLAAAQEIDKLKVLATDSAVTLSLVSDSLADQARFDVYALSEVCLLGDVKRAVRIKQRLQSEGVEPVIVLWALVREIRSMATMAFSLKNSNSPQAKNSLFKQHRIWAKREPSVNAALNRISSAGWAQLLEQAACLDQTLKGQRYSEVGSVWFQIEQLCVAICGVDAVKHVKLRA